MNRITDSQIAQAAALVRNSMLIFLDHTEIADHQFSIKFEDRIHELKKGDRKHRTRYKAMRHCIAALMALIVGMSLLFTINVEARAAVITWIKEVFVDRIEYWFTGESQEILPEYELTWVPEGMECTYDESTENIRSMMYVNINNPADGFTFTYSLMQDGSGTVMILNETEHTISPVDINGMEGWLYESQDSEVTHCLIWFDDERQITFNITSFMDVDDMLHIAERTQLVDSTK